MFSLVYQHVFVLRIGKKKDFLEKILNLKNYFKSHFPLPFPCSILFIHTCIHTYENKKWKNKLNLKERCLFERISK